MVSREPGINRIYALFCDCVDLDPAERDRLLADACSNDPELRRELDALLAAHDESGDAFETPVAPLALRVLADEDPEADEPAGGDRVGSYELVREIGRGGMGRVYLATRQYGDAVQRVAIKLVEPSVRRSLAQRSGRELDAAGKLYREARDILSADLGPDHPAVAYCYNHLAMLDLMNGNLEAARTGFERALKVREAALGPKHREVAYVLNNLGEDAMAGGDLPTAAKDLQRSHDILAAALGPRHPLVAQSLVNLGALRLRTGDLAQSEKLLAEARAIYEESAPRDPYLVMILGRQARTFEKAGQPKQATASVNRSLALATDLLAEEPRNRQLAIWQAESQVIAARLLERTGETEQARALWDTVLGETADLLAISSEAALRVARARALLHSGRSKDGCALVDRLRAQGWRDPAFEETASCPEEAPSETRPAG